MTAAVSPSGARAASAPRLLAATLGVLVCFAANQLLSRAALGPCHADPVAFTTVRLVSGAVALGILVAWRRERLDGGSWISAIVLLAYAVTYSLAYVRVGTGVGALVQFAAVQGTMFGWIVLRGARLAATQWLGLVLALGGVAALAAPGSHAPDAAGTALMLAAGVAWGAYSLRGHGARGALGTTAGNFLRAVPLTLIVSLAAGARSWSGLGRMGLLLAIASGVVASGYGYALWYTVIPALGAARAAVVQLAVPVVAAAGGALLLGERITARLAICAVAILAGIAVTGWSRRSSPPVSSRVSAATPAKRRRAASGRRSRRSPCPRCPRG